MGTPAPAPMFSPHALRISAWVSQLKDACRDSKVQNRRSCKLEFGGWPGKIVRVHAKDVDYKGYIHHASKDEPQYEIKSDKTAHVALHKGGALRRLRQSVAGARQV